MAPLQKRIHKVPERNITHYEQASTLLIAGAVCEQVACAGEHVFLTAFASSPRGRALKASFMRHKTRSYQDISRHEAKAAEAAGTQFLPQGSIDFFDFFG